MRIAFIGKGGSGKTTIASLFAMHMASIGRNVLAFDADINQHLAETMGVKAELPNMGLRQDEIKKHLAGNNSRFGYAEMHKTTPPGEGSRFLSIKDDDWFIQSFTLKSPDGVRIAGAGSIPEGNIGVRCYHGLNGAIELVMGHMIDTQDDVIIVDMTAGADVFSSSLFVKVDALVLVVEPTVKSLKVYEQVLGPANGHGIPVLVVANKINDESDREFISQQVMNVVAWIGSSTYVKRRERGVDVSIADLEPAVINELMKVYRAANQLERDWDRLQENMYKMHEKNADGWMGESAKSQIDPNFSLKTRAGY